MVGDEGMRKERPTMNRSNISYKRGCRVREMVHSVGKEAAHGETRTSSLSSCPFTFTCLPCAHDIQKMNKHNKVK